MNERKTITAVIMITALAVMVSVAGPAHVGPASAYPPADVTGAVNPDVTQQNLSNTVCAPTDPQRAKGKKTYIQSLRPPTSYTDKLKGLSMQALHLPGPMDAYEEDHLISIENGGHPKDPKNLWPEPWEGPYGAHVKDAVENAVHKELCAGTMSLIDAQTCLASDWVACGRRLSVKSVPQ